MDRELKPTLEEILQDEGITELNILNLKENNTNIDCNEKPIKTREVIKEVARATPGVTQAQVKEVLDNFKDLIIREVVTRGTFNYSGVFNIKSRMSEGQLIYDEDKGALIQRPSFPKLKIELSKELTEMYTYARRYENNRRQRVNTENWWEKHILSETQPRDVKTIRNGRYVKVDPYKNNEEN